MVDAARFDVAESIAVGLNCFGEHGRFRFHHRRAPVRNFEELDGIIFAHGSASFS
jgi:hypothetical protein